MNPTRPDADQHMVDNQPPLVRDNQPLPPPMEKSPIPADIHAVPTFLTPEDGVAVDVE